MDTNARTVIRPGEGAAVNDRMIHKVDVGDLPSGGVAIIEGVLGPSELIPPHTHTREDELSYILEGALTFEIGDQVVHAGAGSYVLKPRGVCHAFWNSGDVPARVLEIHTPGGFERYYDDMQAIFDDPELGQEQKFARLRTVQAGYGLTHHPERIQALKARHGLN